MSKSLQSKFLGWGFTGVESKEYGDQFSPEALRDCEYLRKMILDRRMITLNAKQYGWDYNRSVNYIRRQYIKKGIIKSGQRIDDKAVWKMFRWYKDNQEDLTGIKYETPRPKTKTRSRGVKNVKSSKKQMLQDQISLLERNIKVLKDNNTIEKYKRDVEVLKRRLNKYE